MTRDAAAFERLYRDNGDPWDYETSAYEADKYRRCLHLLPRERYRNALEIGCSIGVMSAGIALRCDHLLGIDFAPTAIDRARRRGITNATFEVGAVPEDWPSGTWDLIVLSEVLYYLEPVALESTIACVARDLADDGDCLVVGYTGPTETRLTARQVSGRLVDALTTARPKHRLYQCQGSSWIATAFSSRPDQSPAGGADK